MSHNLAVKYMTFEELRDTMRQKKFETKRMDIPYGKKGKASFAGYSVSCFGLWRYWMFGDCGKCGFGIRLQKRVTKKMHRAILNHLFENPDHEISCNVGFDVPA